MSKEEEIVCTLCSEDITIFGVFDCGHFACYKCALRIRRTFRREPNSTQNRRHGGGGHHHSNNAAAAASSSSSSSTSCSTTNCHVCRNVISNLTITEMQPAHPEAVAYDKSEMGILMKADGVNTKKFHPLNCLVTSDKCAKKLNELIELVCPFEGCWEHNKRTGERYQEPFNRFEELQKHLRVDHRGVKFCETCFLSGFSFLNELKTYSPNELSQHMQGTCSTKDLSAFGGHPNCQFCNGKTVYDGDSLLEHLKTVHYVCDFCNISSYKFIYYNDRDSLNLHWADQHKLCSHPDCISLDPVDRVFASELDLAKHMQTRHGVKQSVKLDALGFRFGAGDAVSSSSYANNHNSNNQGPIATQPSLQTTMITYDFVGRAVTIPLVPKFAVAQVNSSGSRSQDSGGGRGRGRGGGKARNQQQQPSSLEPVRNENANVSAAASATTTTFESNATSTSTSVSETNNNTEKDSEKNADVRLRQILAENLSNNQQRDFGNWTRSYLREEMKAIEYFTSIHKLFPNDHDPTTFDSFFEFLVETLKTNPKVQFRDALLAAKDIVLSAEAKHQKQVREQDAKQQKQVREQDAKQQKQISEEEAKQQKKDRLKQLHDQSLGKKSGTSASAGSGSSGYYGGGRHHSHHQTHHHGGTGGAHKTHSGGQGSGTVWQQRADERKAANDTLLPTSASTSKPQSPTSNLPPGSPWGPSYIEQVYNEDNKNVTTSSSASASAAITSAFASAVPVSSSSSQNKNKNKNKNIVEPASPSLEEAFPTLPPSSRKKANQTAQVKGVWKANKLMK